MKLCIYCSRSKPDEEFSDEHIWPDALGGDALPRDLWRTNDVCGTCNSLSGLYVDGSFIKSWAGSAERTAGAMEYLSRASLGVAVLPLNFIGQLRDVPVSDGEIAEYWSGPCGARIVHIRPADQSDDWASYAGGDPRARKLAAGRAYIGLTSEIPFWIAVSLNSFKKHFHNAQRFVANAAVPPQWSHLVKQVDRTDPIQARDLRIMDAVQDAACKKEALCCAVLTSNDLGTRMMAKLALAIGYKLFGHPFLTTSYAAALRQGLWERDPGKRKEIPVRWSGYLAVNVLNAVPLSWPGGWLLLLFRTTPGLSLSVVTPSGRSMHVLISDDPNLLGTLDKAYNEGTVWITVPVCGSAVGPINLPVYLAHQLGNIAIPELASLSSKRSDPSQLPLCNADIP